MDHLTDLLDHATSAETEAGESRVAELVTKLREIDGVDLAEMESAASGRFEELYADGEYEPEHVASLEALADITDAVRQLHAERQKAKEEQDAKVSQLADRVRTTADDEAATEGGEDAGDDTPEQPADTTEQPEQPDGEPAEQPAAEPTQVQQITQDQEKMQDTRQPVAASARNRTRPNTAAAVAKARPAAPEKTGSRTEVGYKLTAAAEVPDQPFGKEMTVPEMAEAALARYASLPVGQVADGPIKANVGRFHRSFNDEFAIRGDEDDTKRIDALADEKRLPGGSLTAAASALTAASNAPSVINDVWCSPSETTWELCPSLATTEGLLDLPTTGLPRRGGIRYPIWQQYPFQELETADYPRDPNTAYPWRGQSIAYPDNPANPGEGLDNPGYFHRGPNDTPAGDGLGNLKNCIQGPCVEWAEKRMSVEYLCITSDILRDRTFPEATERFISDVLVHHRHYMNQVYLDNIQANSQALPAWDVLGNGQWASSSFTVHERLSLLVTWFRNAYKMSPSATLEIVAPEWFKEFLKHDISQKANRPYGSVSDAEVQDLFASYSSRVQWVRGLDDGGLFANHKAGSAGNPDADPPVQPSAPQVNPPTAWPTSVKLLAYPAGSWVLFQGNILSMGVQYDYQLLRENRYSAMFTEDAWMLLNRCSRSFVIELKNLCNSGAIGGQVPPLSLADGYVCAGGVGPQPPAGSESGNGSTDGADSGVEAQTASTTRTASATSTSTRKK